MPIPPYVSWLRSHVGTDPLWLTGVTGIILRDDPARAGAQQVLLVKRSDNGAYTPVSGIVDPREHPADTIVREAMEEACVGIEVEKLISVNVVGPVEYPNGDVSDYIDFLFRCRWTSGDPRVGDDEATEVGWWSLDSLPDMHPGRAEQIRRALEGDVDPYLR